MRSLKLLNGAFLVFLISVFILSCQEEEDIGPSPNSTFSQDSIPGDSIPNDSIPMPGDSIPNDSIPMPGDSIPIPGDSIPNDSIPIPGDSIPNDSIPYCSLELLELLLKPIGVDTIVDDSVEITSKLIARFNQPVFRARAVLIGKYDDSRIPLRGRLNKKKNKHITKVTTHPDGYVSVNPKNSNDPLRVNPGDYIYKVIFRDTTCRETYQTEFGSLFY